MFTDVDRSKKKRTQFHTDSSLLTFHNLSPDDDATTINRGTLKVTSNFDTGNIPNTAVIETIIPIDTANRNNTTGICTRNLKHTKSLMDTTIIDRSLMGDKTFANSTNVVDIAHIDTKNIFHTNICDAKKLIDTAINATKHAKNIPNTSDMHKIHLSVSVDSTKDIHLPSTADFDTNYFLHVRDLNTSDLSTTSETIHLNENRDGPKDTRSLFENEVEKLLCSSTSNANSSSIQIVTEIINECINTIFFTQNLIYRITNNIVTDFSAETLRNSVDINFDVENDTNVECLRNEDGTKVGITVNSDAKVDTKIIANSLNETATSFIPKAQETSDSSTNDASTVTFNTEGVTSRNVEYIKEPSNTKIGVYLNKILINPLDIKTVNINPSIEYTNEGSTKHIDVLTKHTQDTKILNVGAEVPKSTIHTKIPSIPEIPADIQDTKLPTVGIEIPTNTIDTEICMVIPKSLKNNEVLNTTVDKIIGTSKVVPDESGESNSLDWRNERIALERKINDMEQQVLMQLSRIIRILEKKDQT